MLNQVGLVLVFGVLKHLLNGFQRLLAVLDDELHELVETEKLVLGGEILAVELAVVIFHA